MKRVTRFPATMAAVLAVTGGAIAFALLPNVRAEVANLADGAAPADLAHAESLSQAFRTVARELAPSVVSIRSVKRIQPVANKLPDGFGDSFENLPPEFRRYFGKDGMKGFRFEPQQQRGSIQAGTGTGVIISADGYIVTNNHVVRGADEITVTLHDDREFEATVVGTDSHTDLAVLKIEADVTPAKLGDSDSTEVGDWVLAIGSPFGLDQTVTAGIVSAKSRANVGVADYEDFIQTDAAINPGNSGGPLVNLRGEVVGINTAIASRSGGYAGIGFAIPAKMVGEVSNSLRTNGTVERGRIGALIQNLSEELAESFGYDSEDGVLVGDVLPGSPAEKAGLKSGDIIARYDGRVMRDANHLRNTVAATKPGTEVPVELFRDGQAMNVDVTIGQLDAEEATAVDEDTAEETATNLGMTVRDLTADLAEQLSLGENTTGVVVTKVEADSAAGRAGVRAKDVVLSINGHDVTTTKDFEMALADAGSRGVRLRIARGGSKLFVFLANRD